MPRLAVIDDVTWDGVPVTGPIVRDLLRALVVAGPAGSSDGALLEALWADPPGRNALQTVVSRARRALTAEAVARTATGYRLALDAGEVDAWALTEAAHAAARALASADPDGVLAAARHVADIGARHEGGRDGEGAHAEPVGPAERWAEPGPAERELHARATADRSRLDTALGSVLLALGRDAEALEALPWRRSSAPTPPGPTTRTSPSPTCAPSRPSTVRRAPSRRTPRSPHAPRTDWGSTRLRRSPSCRRSCWPRTVPCGPAWCRTRRRSSAGSASSPPCAPRSRRRGSSRSWGRAASGRRPSRSASRGPRGSPSCTWSRSRR